MQIRSSNEFCKLNEIFEAILSRQVIRIFYFRLLCMYYVLLLF